jgi:mitogen-activated protein kinase kinase kinase kinase 5
MKARHNDSSKQFVAIKVIDLKKMKGWMMNDPTAEADFLKELFKHELIVDYLGSYIYNEKLWIVMELCACSVANICQVTGPLLEKCIAFVCHEMLGGLAFLHGKKMMHRDIKGANIMLTNDGDVKLADFGVAACSTNTKCKSVAGTAPYVAPQVAVMSMTKWEKITKNGEIVLVDPEKANHKVRILPEVDGGYTEKCDIWSAGITAIELAEKVPPLNDDSLTNDAVMQAIAQYDPKSKVESLLPPVLKEDEKVDKTKKQKLKWSIKFHDFINGVLIVDEKHRPTAASLLKVCPTVPIPYFAERNT